MKKILLAAIAAVVCVGGAFAQLSMGPKVGLNVSSITGDGSQYRAGVNVGIFANYRINSLFAIQPEFLYSMQGSAFDDVTILKQTIESSYTSHYIDIPVLLKIYPWRGLNVQVGPQFGFCVDDEYKLKVGKEEVSTNDLKQYGYDEKANTFDFAIAVGLEASKTTIASANAADYVVGIPTLILMFAAPALYKNSKRLKKLWPYEMSEPELLGDGDQEELMASKEWSIQEIAWLLAIGFGTVWAATSISSMVFGEGFRSAGRILLITTFSIILAQVPAIRKLRGNFDLGLFVALLFLVTIGFAVDLQQFFGSTFYITLFCFCVIACSILLHLLITRLLKVRFEYVLLSIVGCISDGPTAALIASSAQWKTLINIGLLMGVLAGALGNYVGIGVAYAIRAFIGA